MMIEKWLLWPERHPRLWHLYCIVLVVVDLIGLGAACWNHDLPFVSFYGVAGILIFRMVHAHPGDDDDDQDEEENDPDWPTGDEVDRWFRNRSKQSV